MTPPKYDSSIVDLRSDTVTRPTPEMYEAMAVDGASPRRMFSYLSTG